MNFNYINPWLSIDKQLSGMNSRGPRGQGKVMITAVVKLDNIWRYDSQEITDWAEATSGGKSLLNEIWKSKITWGKDRWKSTEPENQKTF
jgi:hypothetical protein